MKDKKPDNYTEKQWTDFKEIRDSFIDVLKGEDEARINSILDEHPDNIIPKDDDNEERRVIQWEGCPLRMTASYYANNKVFGEEMPVYPALAIKAILDA